MTMAVLLLIINDIYSVASVDNDMNYYYTN